ncbi:acyl-ACP--UDP-N-acetylglucosamine O-acyltransferase [candidate division KSB1 bacterium]
MRIDERAVIHPEASLADDIHVGPFSIIEQDVIIESGTKIESNVVIASGSRIGQNCRIFPGAVIGTIPQDLKFEGELTTVHIGNNTTVREYCTINRGTKESGKTVVGDDCLLMAYVHVAHDCVLGDHVILANAVNMAGHVSIDDWVIIGGLVPIHQFVRIGTHAFIGGGFRVDKDVPPYVMAAGQPLEYKGLNSIGLRRRNFSPALREKIKSVYRTIYRQGLNKSQALEQLGAEAEEVPEIQEIYRFIKGSERGLM